MGHLRTGTALGGRISYVQNMADCASLGGRSFNEDPFSGMRKRLGGTGSICAFSRQFHYRTVLERNRGDLFFRISPVSFEGHDLDRRLYRLQLLDYLHDVSKFVAVFLHIFHFDLFTNGRSAERHEFGLESHVHVD